MDLNKTSMFDTLVFKSPNQVDWRKTREKMFEWVSARMPEVPEATARIMCNDLVKVLKSRTRRAGVKKTYRSKYLDQV